MQILRSASRASAACVLAVTASLFLSAVTSASMGPVDISGYIRTSGGTAVPGVYVNFSGLGYTTTDSTGKYFFVVPYNWSGTVSPSLTGWAFTPSSRTYANLTADRANENYTAAHPKISGWVVIAIDDSLVADVNVTLSGVGSQFTQQGFFTFDVPAGWSGTVTLRKEGLLFNTVSFTNVVSEESQIYYANLPYDGGSGDANDPFRIATADQLYLLCRQSDHLGSSFILVNDINMAELEIPPTKIFTPIGSADKTFSGSFDGLNHTIRNLKITNPDRLNGLFGGVAGTMTKSATIKNIILENSYVSSDAAYNGILVGWAKAYANIANCHVKESQITSPYDLIGGLIGYAGNTQAGISDITISMCSVEDCNISGGNMVGGLIGAATPATIQSCYADCNVQAAGNYVGGLAGNAAGQIKNSYASGIVQGTQYVGGLIGAYVHDSGPYPPITILNCYAACQVAGVTDKGGLAGYIQDGYTPAVIASYWDLEVSGISTSSAGIGKTSVQMKSAETFLGWGCDGAWTIDEGADYPRLEWEHKPGTAITESIYGGGSGDVNDPYLIYTAEQLNMIGQTCCIDNAFKLMADIDMSELEPSEFMQIGKGLGFAGTFDGSGYAILNLAHVTSQYGGLFWQLGKVVHTSGSFSVVGGTVKNLSLVNPVVDAGANYAGALCGYAVGSTIENCVVIGGAVKGGQFVGGMVGRLEDSRMINCGCQADVTGADNTGGIVGYVHCSPYTSTYQQSTLQSCNFRGTVQGGNVTGGFAGNLYCTSVNECFSIADVNGLDDTGGFAGFNGSDILQKCGARGKVIGRNNTGGFLGRTHSSISDCYSICDVNGSSNAGGFVGYIDYAHDINMCYSESSVDANSNAGAFAGSCVATNPVTDFNSCFYNSEKTPSLPAIGNIVDTDVYGKTTGELRTAVTFTAKGWNFADIWAICEGTNSPKFVWQISPADYVCPDGVSLSDFAFFADKWMNSGCELIDNCEGADIDGSGTVDMKDMLEFASWWMDGI